MSTSGKQHPKRTPILGCIADDVTGATDLAINLVQGGLCVVQLLAIPTANVLSQVDADAVVVGLKTRSIPKEEAVTQSLRCLQAFRDFGIERYFFKYCSTFDSTSEGNIGPVAVALLDELGTGQTIFCPAFPRNGRTVYQGHLFVHDKLLNESGMENHPLNPMTDANLVRFLGQQCDRNVGLLAAQDLDLAGPRQVSSAGPSTGEGGSEFERQDPSLMPGVQSVKAKLAALCNNEYSLVIADACNDEHLATIASAVAHMPLVTGGSGIGRFLPASYRNTGLLRSTGYVARKPRVTGRTLIIAGSCSTATNRQVEWMRHRIPCWELNVDEVIEDTAATIGRVVAWAHAAETTSPLLIYSSASPARVAEVQDKHGAHAAAVAIESCLSESAAALVRDLDMSRLIIAGGETSGAVVKKLGVHALRIGPEICAGVPWTESIGDRPLALALKSGNFGSEDFFEQALRMLP